MKNYFLLLVTIFFLMSCQKENINKVAFTNNIPAQIAGRLNVISSTTTEYWLDFNPYVYCNEFWRESTKAFGSCFTAAVTVVESHLSGVSSISSTAVRDKNAQMLTKGTVNPPISFGSIGSVSCYVYNDFSSSELKAQLISDGFYVSYVGGYSRNSAIAGMINALQNNRWIIALAEYMAGGIGHAYPVYYLKIVKNTDGTINEAASIIKVIDTYAVQQWSSYNGVPDWSKMYREYSLQNFLDHMLSTYGSVYPTFEVSK